MESSVPKAMYDIRLSGFIRLLTVLSTVSYNYDEEAQCDADCRRVRMWYHNRKLQRC